MSINPCRACGATMRVGGNRISVNRKQGVMHYIDHMLVASCGSDKSFSCSMMKPYPTVDKEKPLFRMIEKWNLENPVPS
jgi:hypothetical protein